MSSDLPILGMPVTGTALAYPATPAYDPELDLDDIEDDEEIEDDEDEDDEFPPAAEVIASLRPHLADEDALVGFLARFIDEYDLVEELEEFVSDSGVMDV